MSVFDDYSAKILVELLDHGEANSFSELIRRTDINDRTLNIRLVELSRAGLISDTPTPGFPPRRKIRLTKKGKRVAELFKEILRVLNGQV